ncbi:translesion error-prone DNA polymerase V autoproteolytic subunit [uncultured Aquitalea sp.]|uniref:LexA family protein n=1 Tax=uncultured Aquitalea sp. TaxID=540272 RepID=UPI0025DEC791|nr:translesion error-prone DNA polymerase V autoproteolytic subunit [uncultured Aquitalea sp.]
MRVPEPLKPVIENWLGEYRQLRSVKESEASDIRMLAETLSHVSLPLFASRVPAGSPVAADDLKEADIDLNDSLILKPETTFMVTVKGDSMINAGIHDGDMLIVDRSLPARNGKVVVAVLNGELTVKRLERTSEGLWLMPENPAYKPIEVPEEAALFIWGVVTKVIHSVE